MIIDKGILKQYAPSDDSSGAVLPMTLRGIGPGAFEGCEIDTVTIPDSVRYLDDRAFSGAKIGRLSVPYFFVYKADVFRKGNPYGNGVDELVIREQTDPPACYDACDVKIAGSSPSDYYYEDGVVSFASPADDEKCYIGISGDCTIDNTDQFPVGEYVSCNLWLLGDGHVVDDDTEPHIHVVKRSLGLHVEGVARACVSMCGSSIDVEVDGLIFEVERIICADKIESGKKIAFKGYFRLDLED